MTDIMVLEIHALDEGDVALVAFRTDQKGMVGAVILSMYRWPEPDDHHRGTDGVHFEKDDQSVSGYGLVDALRIEGLDLVLTMSDVAVGLDLPRTIVLRNALEVDHGPRRTLDEIMIRLNRADPAAGD